MTTTTPAILLFTPNIMSTFVVNTPHRGPSIPTRKCPLSSAPRRTTCRVVPKCMVAASNSWSNNEDISARLQSLRNELAEAIRTEDFTKAASLRDAIRKLEMSATDDLAVMLANEAFYDALRTCSEEKMTRVWMKNDGVSCTHPASGLTGGFDDVIAGWRRVFTTARPTQVDVDIVSLEVQRNLAWVICKQNVTSVRARNTFGGERIATNLFQKESGQWRLVHHHSSPVDIGSEEGGQDNQNDEKGGSESV